ncbi:MAG: outer membrane protein transport protein [Proteobacteria bacterium]|nr:outer membrane protein transport protein [Pseudomonadota bacterium]
MRAFKNLLILACLMCIQPISVLNADDTHFNSTILGERAFGMGGAFTAVSDNAAGLYYNPAGIAWTEESLISSSVQIMEISNKTYKGFYNDQTFNKSSFGIIGAYTGYIKSLNKGKIGFSIAIPHATKEEVKHEWQHTQGWAYQMEDGTDDWTFFNNEPFNSEAILEIDYEYDVYNFGPTYSLSFSNNFAIGLTLYAHYKKMREIQTIIKDAYYVKENGSDESIRYENNYRENYSRNLTETGIRPILGIMYRCFDQKLSLGFTFSQTYLLDAEDEYRELVAIFRTSSDSDPLWRNSSYDTHYSQKKNTKRVYPVNLKGGIAFKPKDTLLLSCDLSYFSGSERRVFSKGMNRNYDDKSVLNVALGAEFQISPNYAARCGLFTDLANTPSGDRDLYWIETEHVDLYGISASITRKTDAKNDITLGMSYRFGDGKAVIRVDPELVQDVRQSVYTVFLSATI